MAFTLYSSFSLVPGAFYWLCFACGALCLLLLLPAPPQPLPAHLLAIPPFLTTTTYHPTEHWYIEPDQCDLFYAPSYPVQHSIYLKTNLFCTHTCSLNVTSHTVNMLSVVHLYIKKHSSVMHTVHNTGCISDPHPIYNSTL